MIIAEASAAPAVSGPSEWFTGAVWIETVADEPEPSRLRASRVFFSAGVRTAWHRHPTGQTLHVLAGVARVQGADGPVREIGPGGTIRIDAGERHWHGATPDRPMVHLALQDTDEDGTEATWERHVSDDEYDAGGHRS